MVEGLTTDAALDKERYRQIADEIALRLTQGGGSLQHIIDTLKHLDFTYEAARDVVYALINRDLLKLNSMVMPELTGAGEAYLLESTADSPLIEEIAMTKLDSEMRVRSIGAQLLQSAKTETV